MRCDLCGRTGGHISGCPYFHEPEPKYCCSICNAGIYGSSALYDGEEYIKNDDGEYAHIDCFDNMKTFAEWLGYYVKTMDYGE